VCFGKKYSQTTTPIGVECETTFRAERDNSLKTRGKTGLGNILRPSNRPESKIYLGRLIVRSPRFILDIYLLFTIGFFENIFLNIYKNGSMAHKPMPIAI
jgi:hypothetical protein